MATQGAMPSPLTPALSDNSAGQNSPPSNLPAGPMVSVTQLSSLYHNLQVLAVQFQGLCETLGHVVHDIEATRAVQTVGGHHHEYGAVSAPLSTASAVSGPVKPFFWTQHTGPQPPTEVVDHSIQHQHHSTDHASTIASLQNKVSSLSNLVPAGPVPSAHDVSAASPLTPSSHQNTATNNLSARSLSGIPPISTLPPTLPLEHSNSYTSLGASSPTSSPPLQPNSAVPASPLTPDAKTNAFASAYPASHSPPRAGTSAMSSPASAGPRVAFAGSSNSEHNRSGQRITGLDEADVEVDVEITPPAIVSSVPFTAQSLRPRLSQRRSSGPSPSSSSGTLVAAGESSNHLPALPLCFSSRTSALPPPVRSVSSIDQFQSTSTSTNKPSAPTVQTKSFVYDKFAGRRGGPRSYSVIGAPSDIPRCASMPVLSLDDLRMATEQSLLSHNENRVTLNVGGQVFVTTRTTLSRSGDCMLSALVNSKFGVQTDADGAFFIDRDPTYFRHILNFLRDGSIEIEGHTISQNRSILREARFYQIKGLVCLLEEIVKRSTAKRKSELSDEKVYKLHANVETTKLNEVMNSMTLVEGYDFESWLPGEKGKHHMLFSKKLSRGELALLDQLENKM